MKTTAFRLALLLGLVAFNSPRTWADITITLPAGGNNVSADKALNSTNGAGFTALGNIVLTEGTATDFAAGNGQTFILTVPAGWQFNPGVGTVSFTGSRNITAATISVTASNLTVTFSVNGADKLDALTIGGLQVQAFDGANLAAADYIRNLFDNPGTAVIAGIEQDYTSFGLLNQAAGAARALAMQTQPGANATAGVLFFPQPAVQTADQFGNLRSLDNTTVVTAARAAGSGTLQGTLTRTALFGVASYTNLSVNVGGTITIQFTATNLTSVTSAPVVVGAASAARLVFATQPASACAAVPFGIQPVIKTQDQFGNDTSVGLPTSKPVTVNLSSGSGALSGTTTLDIGTAAGNGTAAFTDVQIDSPGTNKQLTASASGLSNAVSAPFGVSAVIFSKLQLLVPGETAAPGAASGKTGTPSPQTAGTPFNVTVNAVDANWNVVNTIVDTVSLTSSDSNATLPANSALLSGTRTFSVTLNTAGGRTLTTSDLTDGSKTASTSPNITVVGGAPRKLTLQTQPSTTATVGVPFGQQPVIRVEDVAGNLVATDNGRVITVARSMGTAALQGTLTATTVNGLATFTNLSYNVAQTITLNFTATALTNVTSGNVVVGTGPFTKLQLLVPGETATPGTASGKTGTPGAQSANSSFGVTVNAVDAFWNVVNTVSDTVGLSSSSASAILPPATALAVGTTNLTVSFTTNGSFTLTATDLTNGSKGSNTSPAITVGTAQFTLATGGGAISADGATGTFTTLTGPTYSENTTNKVGTGTIILKAPTGFIFDTGGTAPTMLITRLTGSGNNINGVTSGAAVAMTSVTSTQLVFTVTSSSASGTTCKLTWQNVRVRPIAGTPLASGILSRSGTANVGGLTTNANLGLLREVAGAASNLIILTQPSATATAGVAFAQQPVLQVRDQFGNLRNAANGVTNSTLVTAARLAGSGTLQGTLNVTTTNGVASFTNLAHNVATNITISFSASGVSSTNSGTIAISAAAADRLVFTTQPGSTTYGLALSPQPVLKTRDPFGNDSSIGLGASQLVSLTLTTGTGSLLGTTSLDIGTAAGNGILGFSGLQVSMAGTNKQLSASSGGLTSALSSSFDVAKATVIGSITANAKIYDGTTAATIATRALSGALAGDDVSLSGGTASFASKSVGTAKTVTASGLSLSGLNAGNYQLASTSATTGADITARPLTVSATGVNKAYDGTSTASVTLSDNRLAGDSLTTSYASAGFADKNIGTGKNVSVSGIALSGADAANYSANTSTSTTANITARSLNVTATGVNKVYDGNTNASVTLSDNRVAGDSLTTSYTSASFVTKSVGTNKTVSVSGISVTGTDAANYTFNSTASTTANITARSLSVTATASNKVYDGSTSATVTLSDNRLAGDILATSSTSANFANKNAGTAKTITVSGISISGADAANYSANTTASTTADITVRSLSVTAAGVNKLYDGTPAATVTLSDNRLAGDSLTSSYSSASFADKNIGTAKSISVSGITLSGADAANYSANTSASTTANITAASLTPLVSANHKVYDGTTNATIATRSLNGVVGSDDVTLNGGTASFATKTVGTNKSVSVSGLSLSGADAGNYQLASTTATTTANITARSLSVAATGVNRVYNGTTNATATLADNRLAGDSLSSSYASASFADKNIGIAKTVTVSGISITGTDAANYSANTSTSTTADITAKALSVTATAVNKVYDGTTDANVTLSDNRVLGDSLSTSFSSASFPTKSVGTNKTVSVSGISISGADAGNYSANTSASTTANITAKGLTVSGLSAADKVYDATTTATLNTVSAALAGVISGDTVTLNTAGAIGAFADKNVGTNKTVNVSALSLSGADAGNYSLTQPTTTASISKAGLSVTADNKSRAAGQANPTLTASYAGFVGGETLATSGVTGSPALSTTTTNVAGTYPITAALGTLSAANYSFNFVNGVLTVSSASASSLVILTQPSSTATAGVPFAQQPVIAIQDGYGNLRSTDNTTVITAARNAGSGTLQGTLTATAVNGVATFANLSHNVANTINLSFSSSGLTNVTSANIIVSPAAFSRLQLLVPGENAAPGTASGKSGTPSAQIVGASFGVTVNAVDAFWNLVSTVTDTMDLSSSDATATLPLDTALAAGTTNLTVAFGATGNFTLTATDVDDGSKTPSTSPTITVGPAQYTAATGGTAISADGATGTFTTLTGPSYAENASGNVGAGTIILKAPAGFVFDTGGTAPTVRLTSTASAAKNINGASSGSALAMSSVTTTQLTFTVTVASSGGALCTLTWQNVRVRPGAGTPLISGNLSRSGTATVVGLSTNANLGTLREVAGAASRLAIQTQPSATATAGVTFAQQPIIQVRDQFGNLRSTANGVSDSTVVSAARGAGSGTLQGSLNATATNGLATFINLSHQVATNITLAFSASGLTGTNSSTIAVSPAAADRLVFINQPGSATYGSALSVQPVLRSRDAFGNDSTVGLGASRLVSLALSAGSGTLVGTSSLDIGTAAGNGTVSFSGLSVNMAGTGKQLSASAGSLTGAVSSSFTINPATVTGSSTANSKIYDGTIAATIATRSLSGAVAGDDVSLTGGTASFASKSVGTAKTVTATGLSLSGADAGNYQLASTSASTTANITARSLTVSATGGNKTYDGITSAIVTLSDNRLAGDVLTTSYTSASFADKNIGTGKAVSVSGINVTGTDAGNYTFNSTASATANITARALTISATGVNKVYDGTTTATVTLSDNRVAGDSLSTSYSSASFASKNAGTGKTVSVSGINVTGTDAANYTFNSTASTTANITARALLVSAAGINKVYDGSTAATVTLSDDRLAGDSLSSSYTSASFANKNVGSSKTVSVSGIALSGADAVNYSASTSASTSADITVRSLSVSASGVNKVYDGTTAATVTLSDNRVAGDSLTASYSASFADPYVGTAKPVSVSTISLGGADAGNYSANSTASATANITAASLTAAVSASNKVYDGTTAATIASRSLNGVLGSDDVSLSGGTASFASKTVGTNKAVSVTGLGLGGADAANYQLASNSVSTTANITKSSLSVTATGVGKVYNGTTSATVTLSDNRLAGDVLTTSYTNASFANKNVGTAKTITVSGIAISGTDAPNYTANTSVATTADITSRSLNVTATGSNKVYDGTPTATVALADDRLAGDSLAASYTSASFADKNIGTAKSVSVSGISISGADAGNYTANSSASATANITSKGLTVSGITAADKVYDASTSASLNTASAALAGVISGDNVTLNTASGTGAFADKSVGTGKSVTVLALSLSGADAANYTLTQPTTSASITKAGLTVTADNKTRAAGQTNPVLTVSYSGFVGGETLATSGVTGSPSLSTTTTNVAGTYPITAALGTLAATNYSFSLQNGQLTVTPASASQMVILTQPSSTATAGVSFAQQPAIGIKDAYGNLRTTDNSTVVTVARNAGSGTLQGTLSATVQNGVATFANLSHNVANTINLSFSSSGLTNVTSANIIVSPAAFSRLQLLVPGEAAAPGTASGKTGTPSAQIASASFGVTVNAVDAFWNLVNTVTDTVDLSSSDATATLPPDTALAAGTTNLTVAFNATGNFTLTATDVDDGSKTASISPAITVSPAQFTQATGGAAISADGATGTFTSLTGPTYSENASGNVGAGTIILKAPAGFVFDIGGTAPTVLITRIAGSGNNINGVSSGAAVAMSSVTSTQMVFTVTSPSSSSATCKLTWQNVRVRPAAGAPLISGNLVRSGTANVVGLSTNVNLGTLREVAGAAKSLAIQTQPSATAVAGVPFAQQPVIQVRDQFGNLRSTANGVSDSTVVSAARNAGSGTLQGTLNATATNGLATFINLSHNVATNITLAFSGSGLTGTNSSIIAVTPAAADRLVFITQPGSATYGSALSVQPVLKTRDAFGNDSTVGLGASQLVTLSVSAGSGSLLGTSSLDIGTAAGNGTVVFSGLTVNMAGTGKQLTAASSGLTSALSSSFTINPATVSGSVSANNKIYDGTTAAIIATRSLSGALPGDDVSLSGGIASFATKSVGTAKTVTATGLSLSGADAANYQLASTTASAIANITTRSLTVSATGVNKAYDGNTSATVTLTDDRIAGDSLTTSYVSASFADKNIGTAKPVSVSGISLSGTDAANYSANTTASTTANITAKALTITATGANKVYDGITDATVTLSDNRVAGDSLSTSYTAATFASKSVGTAKAVSVSGISVTGTDAGNYTFNSTASTTANITARSLTVTAAGVNKVYDGTTAATVTLADNRLSGDSLTASYTSASFANKSVGTAKSVSVSGISLSGADAVNYSANSTASATADITVRSLTVSATGVNKVYDGTTAATVTLADNRVAGDSLTTSYSASFADPYVGVAKPVSVSSIAIGGTDAANYSANTTVSTTANITAASLTAMVSANNKAYDGTTSATIATRSLSGVLGSDDVSLSGGTASFATKTVGTNKTVSAIGLSLSGADSANYQLASNSVSTTANITKAPLTIAAAGVNKVYNGTTSATVTLSDNRVAGDVLTTSYTNASFADKNVGVAKTVSVSGISVSGTDVANYSANTSASTTADITAKALTVSATGVNKVYDGAATASVTLSDNRLAGDVLTASYTSAIFADKNVGTAKSISVSGISISGADAANYSANDSTSTTANITTKGLMVSGISASDKVYDANTSASLNTASAALVGVISGDSVTLNSASTTGAFADKNVGTGKSVAISALSLSGTDAGNYTLTQPATIASITKAGLTVTADNKSRAAGQANPTLTASYSGFVGGETLATSGVTGSPALSTTTTNVAGTYPITAAQGTLSAANYSFGFVNGVLTVTPASASSLVIVSQPSSTATAGVTFSQQPAIAIKDAYGNLRSTDNSTVVTVTRNASSGTLQGTLSATAVNGVATFANLSHNVANTINLSFSSSGLTNVTSANVVVSPAAFAQLQLLVPGETAAPGTVSGKTGTPSAQSAGISFGVTVNAVDAFWNLVNTATDTVGLSSSDATADLPPDTDLAAGTTTLIVYLNTPGNFTITATDLTVGSKTPSTSPAITVGSAQFTQATGGTAISADAATGTFTTLAGPSYSENASGNVGAGTIILKAPAGFIFDITAPAPTVKIETITSGFKGANINGVASGTAAAMTSVSSTQLVFTVSTSSSANTCKLTWQNVRVRPTAGTPLAGGNLSPSGTAVVVGMSTNANLGVLREVAGAAAKLTMLTQPSATATAGVVFAQQPTLRVEDKYGNLRNSANGTSDNATMVTASRNAGAGVLQGTLTAQAADGVAAFTNLAHNVATNITITFSSGTLTNAASTAILIAPAIADHLVFDTQPGNGVVGLPLATQPRLCACDQFGNHSTVGLGTSRAVSLTLGSGTGPLLGTTVMDIGTNAGNGIVACLNLGVDSAGTNKQLAASASGLSAATSSVFSVAKTNQTITFSPLPNMTYGDPSFSPSATASSGLPIAYSILSGPATVAGSTVTITGAGTVTIRASQAGNNYWMAAVPVDRSFTVAKATLTVKADDKSRAYGAANPSFAVSYSGFVNQDDSSVLSGTASLATTATLSSSVAGNPYAITVAQGTLNAANYSFTFLPGTLTVTPSPLSVVANNASRLYGQPNPTLTGTLTGVRNGDNITASYTTVAGASSAAGAYAIIPSLADPDGKLTNYAVASSNGTLTVGKVTLTVTAQNQSRVYGAPNPPFTVSYNGFVSGDDSTVLSGNPDLSTTATSGSSVAGGPYVIAVSRGTLDALNYNFAFVNGQLTVSPASSANVVTTSANPSPTAAIVTFAATLGGVLPSTAVPTGTVQFISDGSPLGSPVTLNSGVASLSTSTLTHGIHTIVAEYAGDGNFFGSTNTLGSNQVVNTQPLASTATYTRATNAWLQIPIATFMTTYTTDADGDALTLLSVGSGTNGATVLIFGGSIYYLPSDTNPNRNSTDHLDYAVTDGFPGSTATNQIQINLDIPVSAGPAILTGLSVGAGTCTLTFTGSANSTYWIQRTSALGAGSTWLQLGSATTDADGQGQFTDTNPPPAQAFYRTASH